MLNDLLLDYLYTALTQLAPDDFKKTPSPISWATLGEAVAKTSLEAGQVLAEAALIAQRHRRDLSKRAAMEYIVRQGRKAPELRFSKKSVKSLYINPEIILEAVHSTNRTIEKTHSISEMNSVPIFALLGLRNLSSFVGEIFARELQSLMKFDITSNPNQDGYPDLLAMTEEGRAYYNNAEREETLSDKSLWSPFPYGGIEVKATCGSTPPAKQRRKPNIGEARTPLLIGLDWKSHHRNTNHLLGLYWDFVDGLPTLVGAFYRNDLSPQDWGEVIKPREGGGHTTSVSIMNRTGVKRMGQGWLVLPRSTEYLPILARRSLLDLEADKILSS